MPIPAYRAKQSTNTTGAGTIVLAAAETNARSFSAAYGASSRRIMYAISWSTGFEIGLGDFDGGTPGNLTRATVLASSNAGALVTLPAGTKDVFAVFDPAAREVVSISATATLTLSDLGNAVVFTGSSAATLNLPAVATAPLGAGWLVMNGGTAALTIEPSGVETINGASTLVLQGGQAAMILRIASAWQAAVMIGPNVTGDLSVGGVLSVGGAIRMQTGTAALPAITPVGDPNTGIFSPGADVLAGSVGGAEAFRVVPSRDFLFGTETANVLDQTSGNKRVVIAKGDNSITLGGSLAAAVVSNTELTTNNTSQLNFAALTGGGNTNHFSSVILAAIHGARTAGEYHRGDLVIMTAPGGNIAPVERMRVPGSGAITINNDLDVSGNLRFDSGYGSVAQAFGCRAWVNFNGTGTVAIRASGNVSSITDHGTGDYTVNFTTNMPDANYSYNVVASNGGEPLRVGFNATGGASVEVAPTTSAFRFYVNNAANTAQVDPKYVNVSVFR